MRMPFHLMAKPTSFQCNLDCDYCFYLDKEKLFGKSSKERSREKITAMSGDVLRTYIKQYITSQDTQSVEFTWQGGEPTTAGLDFFKLVVRYQKKFAGNKQITNSIQTNGVLLNDKWCAFLKEHDFLVGVSIDGPEELHDHYRVSQGGKPTFKKVLKGIENLKKHGVEFNTLTVINNVNAEHPLKVYDFLKEIGSQFHQFIPIVEQQETNQSAPLLIFPEAKSEKKLMPFSVSGERYGKFMKAIFDEWVRKDVGKIYVQLFDNALASWVGQPSSLCLFQKECGLGLVIERSGDIYSCDHYVYPQYKVGNIQKDKLNKVVNSKPQRKFAREKARVGSTCEQCRFLFACNGGCPKHRIHSNADGTRQNHLCSGYKAIFSHMDPYLRFMGQQLSMQRAPASVMAVADRIAASQ